MSKPIKKSQTLLVGLMMAGIVILFITTIGEIGGERQTREEKQALSTLEETLEQMDGLGKVVVYFHYDEQGVEESLSSYFSISSPSKKERPLKGLLVVAEGAEDAAVRNELSNILANVLQLPEHRIVIVEMKKRGNHLESE